MVVIGRLIMIWTAVIRNLIILVADRTLITNPSQWFSGKIRACHARAPCSIHGCDISFAFAPGDDASIMMNTNLVCSNAGKKTFDIYKQVVMLEAKI
jgi:hypothetical protein